MSKVRILFICLALLLSAIGCMLSMVGGTRYGTFSTQPWLDSFACSTDWYPYTLGNGSQDWNTILGDRIVALDLDMELENIQGYNSGNGPCYQTTPPNLHAIELGITVPTHIIEDDAALGYRIRRLIFILERYHDDLAPPNNGNLTVYFVSPERQYRRWSFQYSQAVEAVNAHLSNPTLFELGHRP